jgi:hypothetical protein
MATVCVPWRPSPSRMKPFRRVIDFYRTNFPDWPIILSDSNDPDDVFNLAQARNNAVAGARTDVIVINDADTIVSADTIRACVADPVGVTWPHSEWRLIPAEYADKPIETFPHATPLIRYSDGLGGVMVCRRDEYWRLGGQPEEFRGWGCEDCAFHLVVLALSSFRRMPGVAYSIDHNKPTGEADSPGWSRNGPQRQRNMELLQIYQAAGGRAWLMREIIKTRHERQEVPTPENDPLAGRYKG